MTELISKEQLSNYEKAEKFNSLKPYLEIAIKNQITNIDLGEFFEYTIKFDNYINSIDIEFKYFNDNITDEIIFNIMNAISKSMLLNFKYQTNSYYSFSCFL